jgi:hypothetical protein
MAATNRVLDASYRDLTPDGLAALLADSDMANVTTILLEGNPIGDRGAMLLAGWPGIARVEVLNLADTGIGLPGLKVLVESSFQPQPVTLQLDENPLYDEGIQLLAGSSLVSRVRELGLGCTGLDHSGVRALVESTKLASVQTLDLGQTELMDESWRLLRARFPSVMGA